MKQKLIALTVASLLAAPVFADTTVYGKADVIVEHIGTSDAAAGKASSYTTVASNASRLGVKGSEDLGDGLKAIYQIEAQVAVDGNSTTGTFNGSRDSFVGLQGSFGTVKLGIADMPYKKTHGKIEYNRLGNKVEQHYNDVLARTTKTTGITKSQSFTTRQTNVIQYWSPTFDGFQVALAYAPNPDIAAYKPVTSFSATYDNSLFYGAYGYESKKDASFTGQTDKSHRLAGVYRLASGQIGLVYERLSVGTSATTESSRNGWELSGQYNMGASNFGAYYNRAGDMDGVADSGADRVLLRYGYVFSKRTELYGLYTRLSNDNNASYNFSGSNLAPSSNAGAALTGLGVGMIHKF